MKTNKRRNFKIYRQETKKTDNLKTYQMRLTLVGHGVLYSEGNVQLWRIDNGWGAEQYSNVAQFIGSLPGTNIIELQGEYEEIVMEVQDADDQRTARDA